MVANKNKFNEKMVENEYTIAKLAKALNLTEEITELKINSEEHEFTIGESVEVKKIWGLSDTEYLNIFIEF